MNFKLAASPLVLYSMLRALKLTVDILEGDTDIDAHLVIRDTFPPEGDILVVGPNNRTVVIQYRYPKPYGLQLVLQQGFLGENQIREFSFGDDIAKMSDGLFNSEEPIPEVLMEIAGLAVEHLLKS